jgi:hypothetical protein
MRVWQLIRAWTGAVFQTPSSLFRSTEEWWVLVRKRVPKNLRKDFDTVTILVHWKLWKERNSRVFEKRQQSEEDVFGGIREDISLWRSAGRVVAL